MTDTLFDSSKDGVQPSPPWLNAVALMLSRARRTLAARRDRRILLALPDTLLKDIGINRGNIDYIVTCDPEDLFSR